MSLFSKVTRLREILIVLQQTQKRRKRTTSSIQLGIIDIYNILMTTKNQNDDEELGKFIEHISTPLNACSVETLPDPIALENNTKVWPLMLGCYELNETTGEREGRLDFYSIQVPTSNTDAITGFGTPINIIGEDINPQSGILDGKWFPQNLNNSYLYATAHASGEIILHKIAEDSNSFQISQSGTSEQQEGLCLALAWDIYSEDQSSTRIISSYSHGKVAIHQANLRDKNSVIELKELECWDAHKMFHSPAEVWSANFTSNSNVIMTGGDEGNLKIWDLRAGLSIPMHTLKNFEAGVTVISPHPRIDNVVACGSYDETVAIFDLRKVSNQEPKPLCHSKSMGGGLWRIKWHPSNDNQLLLGAMHGGCRVVQLNNENSDLQILQKFSSHQSMAYGADWLAFQDQTKKVEAVASCSFYDRALYLWEVQNNNSNFQ